MKRLRILVASTSKHLFAELQYCFRESSLDSELIPLGTIELFLNYCTNHPFNAVIVEANASPFPLESVLDASRRFNPECAVYVLFDTLNEAAIASALHRGATSFCLKQNLSSLVSQLENQENPLAQRISPNHLIDSKQVLNVLLKESPDSIWVKSKEGKYLMINPAGARFLKKPIDQIIGKSDHELFPKQTADKIVQSDQNVMLNGQTQTIEDLITTQNGDERLFLAIKGVLKNDREEIQGVIGTVRDITLRKKTEETLQQSEQRFRLLVAGIKDHFYKRDKEKGESVLKSKKELR